MGYKVRIDSEADKTLGKMDASVRKRLYKELLRIESLPNPRDRGHALHGDLEGFWTYPLAANWRAVCAIQDKIVTVLVIDIGHRSNVYR